MKLGPTSYNFRIRDLQHFITSSLHHMQAVTNLTKFTHLHLSSSLTPQKYPSEKKALEKNGNYYREDSGAAMHNLISCKIESEFFTTKNQSIEIGISISLNNSLFNLALFCYRENSNLIIPNSLVLFPQFINYKGKALPIIRIY